MRSSSSKQFQAWVRLIICRVSKRRIRVVWTTHRFQTAPLHQTLKRRSRIVLAGKFSHACCSGGKQYVVFAGTFCRVCACPQLCPSRSCAKRGNLLVREGVHANADRRVCVPDLIASSVSLKYDLAAKITTHRTLSSHVRVEIFVENPINEPRHCT